MSDHITREQTDALAKLAEIPPIGSEERKAWIAMASRHAFRSSPDAILALMSEARKQGQRDVLGAGAAEVVLPCISSRDQFPERRGDWMQTATGRRFWPLDPRPEDVCIEDIAHALSLQCRYGGHCLWFYSVAEHSVLLARWALDHGAGSIGERRILALWLLLHDGGEGYVSDVVRPLKRHMPEFRQIEDGVSRAIYEHAGLDPAMEPREVKRLDNRILMDERAQAMRSTGDDWDFGGENEPLGVKLQFWTPERAEAEFVEMFAQLATGPAEPEIRDDIADLAACAERELAQRLRAHPRWVEAKRMTQALADRQTALMRAIAQKLRAEADALDIAGAA